jgi:hypothetical protein
MRTLVLSLILARLLYGLWSGATQANQARAGNQARPEVVLRH